MTATLHRIWLDWWPASILPLAYLAAVVVARMLDISELFGAVIVGVVAGIVGRIVLLRRRGQANHGADPDRLS
jgi:hypothetical protein